MLPSDRQPGPSDQEGEAGNGVTPDKRAQLETGLGLSQQQLRALREEHEATVAALLLANEELQSTNEEYRSTLEELETSKEELQSINEALQTVNQELENKVIALRQSEERFQLVLRNSPTSIYTTDRHLRYTWIYNPMPGFTPEMLIGKRDEELLPFESVKELIALKQRVLETGDEMRQEIRTEIGGDAHYFDIVANPTLDAEGNVAGLRVAVTDITAIRKTEEALHTVQESLAIALEAARMGTWDLDLASNRVHTNLRHNEIFGYGETVADWTLGNLREHILPEDQDKLDENLQQALESGSLNVELRVGWPDGSVHWINKIGRVYYDNEGAPVHVAGVTVETTERKEAQVAEMRQHIIQSQERERSHLAREIHDGPVQELAALTFELMAAADRVGEEAQGQQLITFMTKIEGIIKQLRQIMMTLRPPALSDFGLVAAIENHIEELRRQHSALSIVVLADEGVDVLSDQMVFALYRIAQQALYNVVHHASADHVWVRLRLDVTGTTSSGRSLVLEIEDDGQGFEVPETWVNLTRRQHLGIVGMIERAEAIGGRLTVESAPGEGSLVRITLPLAAS